jgi:hypothetical protein
MSASVLAAPFKYSGIGKDVVVCTSVANIASPTRAEINAGTNINKHLDKDSGLTGFELTHNTVTATSLGDGIGYPLNDGNAYGTATIVAHQSKTGAAADVRSVFTEGATVYILIFDTIDTPALKMDVFQVTVNPITKARAGVQMLTVPVDIGNSARDVTVPA